MIKKTFMLLLASICFGASQLQAIPLAYHCEITDYRTEGTSSETFIYSQVGQVVQFDSSYSRTTIYLDVDHTLRLTLRPLESGGHASQYTFTEGYDLPHQLSTGLTIGPLSYAARLHCQI